MVPSPHPCPARARAVVRRLVDVVAITLAFAVVIALTLPPAHDHVAEAPSPVAARAPL